MSVVDDDRFKSHPLSIFLFWTSLNLQHFRHPSLSAFLHSLFYSTLLYKKGTRWSMFQNTHPLPLPIKLSLRLKQPTLLSITGHIHLSPFLMRTILSGCYGLFEYLSLLTITFKIRNGWFLSLSSVFARLCWLLIVLKLLFQFFLYSSVTILTSSHSSSPHLISSHQKKKTDNLNWWFYIYSYLFCYPYLNVCFNPSTT